MPLRNIDLNKVLTILSIVIALGSIGVFSTIKSSIDKVQNVLDSVDRIELLEAQLTADKMQYNDVINEYKKTHFNDSVRLDGTLFLIESLKKKRTLDSSYIYWNYDWIVYLRKQHNL